MLQTYPVTLKLASFGKINGISSIYATLKLRTNSFFPLDGIFEVSATQVKSPREGENVITFHVYSSVDLNAQGFNDGYYLLTCKAINNMEDLPLWVPIGGGDISDLLVLSSDGLNVPAPITIGFTPQESNKLDQILTRLEEQHTDGGTF